MTKMKSKKMTKSTFAIIIMAIAMVAMLAFGGTYAYFTATADASTPETVTTGTIKLNAGSAATIENQNAVSGTELLTGDGVQVSLAEETNVDTWVFAQFSVALKKGSSPVGTPATDVNDDDKIDEKDCKNEGDYALVYKAESGWIEVETGVYAFKVDYNETNQTLPTIPSVCTSIKFYGCTNYDLTKAGGTLMGATIELTIGARAIQAEGFTGTEAEQAAAAWTAVKGVTVA